MRPQLRLDLFDHLRRAGGDDGDPAERWPVWSTSATVRLSML
jgi:hypothetical protein